MSAEEALDRVYAASSDPTTQAELYDDWAASYDHDLEVSGYATPGRIAELLAEHLTDHDAPVLDFGCGSGMSGRALADAGFTTIDGTDLSTGMLEQAEHSGAYRRLWQLTAGQLDVSPGTYRAVVACGVISVGAAPAGTLTLVASAVGPGDMVVVSFNDHTLEDDEYMATLQALLDDGFEQVAAEHGVHIASRDMGSTVFLLRRRD
ncbi:class I SAM-dependent DNA methyltransferase [Ilumatobacter nonamiensis]|uniref:class I SAM-dependent DNA methyltransferase n=1 Tax=Ilumatobacter nonamiensis TaxID=467093 RepID=UPI00058B5C6F|nr:methyltransferase domain-containing protein [Ilumatobacter nonamiensis]